MNNITYDFETMQNSHLEENIKIKGNTDITYDIHNFFNLIDKKHNKYIINSGTIYVDLEDKNV